MKEIQRKLTYFNETPLKIQVTSELKSSCKSVKILSSVKTWKYDEVSIVSEAKSSFRVAIHSLILYQEAFFYLWPSYYLDFAFARINDISCLVSISFKFPLFIKMSDAPVVIWLLIFVTLPLHVYDTLGL